MGLSSSAVGPADEALPGWQLDGRTGRCLFGQHLASLLQKAACGVTAHGARRLAEGGHPRAESVHSDETLGSGPRLSSLERQGPRREGEPRSPLGLPSLLTPSSSLFSSPSFTAQSAWRLCPVCTWSHRARPLSAGACFRAVVRGRDRGSYVRTRRCDLPSRASRSLRGTAPDDLGQELKISQRNHGAASRTACGGVDGTDRGQGGVS